MHFYTHEAIPEVEKTTLTTNKFLFFILYSCDQGLICSGIKTAERGLGFFSEGFFNCFIEIFSGGNCLQS